MQKVLNLSYYAGVPFARSVSAEEREQIEAAISEVELTSRKLDETLRFDHVTVTSKYAYVEFSLPVDDYLPSDVLSKVYQEIGGWHFENGPLSESTRLGGAQECGTISALGLDNQPVRDTAAERLTAKEEQDLRRPDHRHSAVLHPTRLLTEDEQRYIKHVAAGEVTAAATYVVLHGVRTPGTARMSPVHDAPALLTGLRNTSRLDDSAEIGSRQFWSKWERVTLPSVGYSDRECIQAAEEYAQQQTTLSPPTADAKVEQSNEVSQ